MLHVEPITCGREDATEHGLPRYFCDVVAESHIKLVMSCSNLKKNKRVAAMASKDREVEKELARREYRIELECKSRRDLQSLAKNYRIPANLKSNAIIDGILHWDNDDSLDVSYHLTYCTSKL